MFPSQNSTKSQSGIELLISMAAILNFLILRVIPYFDSVDPVLNRFSMLQTPYRQICMPSSGSAHLSDISTQIDRLFGHIIGYQVNLHDSEGREKIYMQFICNCNWNIIEQIRLLCVKFNNIHIYFENSITILIDVASSNPIRPSVTPKNDSLIIRWITIDLLSWASPSTN